MDCLRSAELWTGLLRDLDLLRSREPTARTLDLELEHQLRSELSQRLAVFEWLDKGPFRAEEATNTPGGKDPVSAGIPRDYSNGEAELELTILEESLAPSEEGTDVVYNSELKSTRYLQDGAFDKGHFRAMNELCLLNEKLSKIYENLSNLHNRLQSACKGEEKLMTQTTSPVSEPRDLEATSGAPSATANSPQVHVRNLIQRFDEVSVSSNMDRLLTRFVQSQQE